MSRHLLDKELRYSILLLRGQYNAMGCFSVLEVVHSNRLSCINVEVDLCCDIINISQNMVALEAL